MKKIVVKLFLVVVLCGSGLMLHAQGPGDPGDGDPEDIPLDPGSWVLVAAGVGYGIKKWRDARLKPNGDAEENTGLPGEK